MKTIQIPNAVNATAPTIPELFGPYAFLKFRDNLGTQTFNQHVNGIKMQVWKKKYMKVLIDPAYQQAARKRLHSSMKENTKSRILNEYPSPPISTQQQVSQHKQQGTRIIVESC